MNKVIDKHLVALFKNSCILTFMGGKSGNNRNQISLIGLTFISAIESEINTQYDLNSLRRQ